MPVRRMDGAFSRMMRRLSHGGRSNLCAGLDATGRCAEFLGSRMRDSESRLRWLELRNKIAAYRLFQGRGSIRELDPYQRIFAAEGFSYRRALQGSVAPGPSSAPVCGRWRSTRTAMFGWA